MDLKPNYRSRPVSVHAAQAEHVQYIKTSTGTSRVNAGDWIVTMASGDQYALKNKEFEKAFELVQESSGN